MRRVLSALVLVSTLGCAALRTSDSVVVTDGDPWSGPSVLCVVAHPDDETTFAATLYATSHLLDGACDVVVVTNGEGGFKYSTLAEPLYGLELTDEEIGRAQLPEIRRREMLAGCRVMGVRGVTFLGERDHRYTTDVDEVLGPDAEVWDLARVRGELQMRLVFGSYDFLLVLWPREGTHAHHKAATLLALEAVGGMPPEGRPVVLGAFVTAEGEEAEFDAEGLTGYPITRPRAGASAFEFDRTRTLGHQGRLDWGIVVDWVIAEHKSQGTMQLASGRGAREHFVLFDVSARDAEARATEYFERLAGASFPVREYGTSAGTNAGAR